MDLGQFSVMFIGGMIGVILMRFAATWFVELLNKYPGLEGSICYCRLGRYQVSCDCFST